MPDDVPVYRHWILLRTLGARRYGLTVREMAREMGVAEKTIRRDLALFQRLGFPLRETDGERGKKTWRLAGEGSAPPLQFTFDEAVDLYLQVLPEPEVPPGPKPAGQARPGYSAELPGGFGPSARSLSPPSDPAPFAPDRDPSSLSPRCEGGAGGGWSRRRQLATPRSVFRHPSSFILFV